MCGWLENTSGQRIQINFDLKKSRIKLIKVNQGLNLIGTFLSWSKSKWDRGETTNWKIWSNQTKDKVLDVRWKI